jgi:hypothetical protein
MRSRLPRPVFVVQISVSLALGRRLISRSAGAISWESRFQSPREM